MNELLGLTCMTLAAMLRIGRIAAANDKSASFRERNDRVHELICLLNRDKAWTILLKAKAELPRLLCAFAGHFFVRPNA